MAHMWRGSGFRARSGLVSGVLTAAAVVGQFALLPLWTAAMTRYGWQAPIIGCGLLTIAATGLNWLWMGEAEDRRQDRQGRKVPQQPLFLVVGEVVIDLLRYMRRRPFWILVLLSLICGAKTNGIMWSHFTPAAVDCGITVEAASFVLALIGIFNVAGTMAAGWLADRMSSRVILMVVFFGGRSLCFGFPSYSGVHSSRSAMHAQESGTNGESAQQRNRRAEFGGGLQAQSIDQSGHSGGHPHHCEPDQRACGSGLSLLVLQRQRCGVWYRDTQTEGKEYHWAEDREQMKRLCLKRHHCENR
jgi:hypothetical protein